MRKGCACPPRRLARPAARALWCLLLWGSTAAAAGPPAGLSPARLEEAVASFTAAVDRDDIRGAVLLVAQHGEVVLHEAVGWRDKDAGLPMERDTLFRMASNTKPVVASAVLMLVDEGKVDLDAPIGRYLAAFDNELYRGVKVRHLLTHTSGLRIPTLFIEPLMERSAEHPLAPNLQLEVNRFAQVAPKEKPGKTYSYSNPGFNILGALVEVVSGQPLAEFLAERIYRPLGMSDTCHDPVPRHPDRMAVVYARTNRGWSVRFRPEAPQPVPFVRASGGMISTAADYLRFCQMYLDGGTHGGRRLLSQRSIEEATSPQTSTSSPAKRQASNSSSYYGFGWSVSADGAFSHGGSDGTFAWCDPQRQLVVLVFTQSPGGKIPRDELIDAVRVMQASRLQ